MLIGMTLCALLLLKFYAAITMETLDSISLWKHKNKTVRMRPVDNPTSLLTCAIEATKIIAECGGEKVNTWLFEPGFTRMTWKEHSQ